MRGIFLVGLLTVVACDASGIPSTTGNSVVTTSSPISTSTSIDSGEGCPESLEFASEGRVLRVDQVESDTSSIGVISWTSGEACERFEIDFETVEGAPATTPPSTIVEFLDTLQVIRVHIGAKGSVITDQLVDTPLVDRLYFVRSESGDSFIDFHLKSPVQARARVMPSPAQLILDLQPGALSFTGAAAVSDKTVMTSPFEGASTSTNIEVSGYAMVQSGTVTVLATAGGRVVAESLVTVVAEADEWVQYRTRLDLPVGATTIFAGEPDPDDGRLSGITVGIQVR